MPWRSGPSAPARSRSGAVLLLLAAGSLLQLIDARVALAADALLLAAAAGLGETAAAAEFMRADAVIVTGSCAASNATTFVIDFSTSFRSPVRSGLSTPD